jgi:HD-GYP domain-containing protein (c-di-GMP phosphodiesterase class II)
MRKAKPAVSTLRSLEFFADMPDEHLRLVARVARVRVCRKNELIIQENTVADTFYIIRRGRVAIIKRLDTGEEMVLGEEAQGGFFGEMALLDEGPRSATAKALEPTSLLEISRVDFKVLLDQAPLLAYAMMRVLSSRLRGSGALLVSQLQRKNRELSRAYLDTINAVVNTLEARDPYTRGHTERVTQIAKSIAHRMGITDEELFIIELGALLHDVGKIGVADAILRKPGPLDSEEYMQIREHPDKGRIILSNIAYLQRAIPCVLHHHERYDGKGYPERLSGTRIPLPGRIISVADAFDAMTSDRPYRSGLPVRRAMAELRRNAGRQFDPVVVEAFMKVWRQGRLAPLLAAKRKG